VDGALVVVEEALFLGLLEHRVQQLLPLRLLPLLRPRLNLLDESWVEEDLLLLLFLPAQLSNRLQLLEVPGVDFAQIFKLKT
jgi:hypothetical protein